MKYDLHIHTKYSKCALLEPKGILKIAKKLNLDGIAVTDHNTLKGADAVAKLNKDKNFKVIKGAEMSTEYGEVLCYYIHEEIKTHALFELIDNVKKQGGLVAIAHPFRSVPWLRFKYPIKQLNKKLKNKIDAIETFNSRNLPGDNLTAQIFAEKNNIPQTGGSDAHFSFDIGRGYTLFNGDLRKAIKERKTKVGGTILLGCLSGMLSFVKKRI